MEEKEIIEKIREEAKNYFQGTCPSHDWTHVERVERLAIAIAKKERADLFITQLSAILHDIGRKREMEDPDNLDHAEISAQMAAELLKKYDINGDIAKQVIHCISSHRFRKNHKPKTLEAKVLFDADKIDCLGAVGIARAYAWAGKQGIKLYSDKDFLGTGYEPEHSPVTEFTFKLSKVKDRMMTQTGRITAHYRHKYLADFFERLKHEAQGEVI